MFALTPTTRVYLAAGATDMRKSFNSLAAIVANTLGRDPTSGHLFAFCNRCRNRLKILYWDGSGLWVCAKRLEKGTFAWPKSDARSVELSREELVLLVSGLDLSTTHHRRWYRIEADRNSAHRGN
ncbi:MAG TPA: IS66 family insertion sequence element accessory protein TnpB [Candidatus Binatia bacterium]|nr:IS66 family insertion sequence element accessory protein TnpB [Candidatus Binatia bacterium]